jgi:arginase
MTFIKLVQVKSELGAGTRGASMGIDALKTACLDKESDYFARYPSLEVKIENDSLFRKNQFPHAKHIDSVYKVLWRVSNSTREVLDEDYFPIVLAGDHSTAAGTIAGVKAAHTDKRIGAIWIDAHADLHSPYTSPSGNMHGMPLAIATAIDNQQHQRNTPSKETTRYWNKLKNMGGKGENVSPSDIVFIAMRDFEEEEVALIEKHQIKNFPVADIDKIGVEAVVQAALERLKDCDYIYVSFDVDSIDSSISEGTGTPVANGLTVAQAKEINRLLIRSPKVCCWEMVEVNPTLDTENTMAEHAFDILEIVTQSLIESREEWLAQNQPDEDSLEGYFRRIAKAMKV